MKTLKALIKKTTGSDTATAGRTGIDKALADVGKIQNISDYGRNFGFGTYDARATPASITAAIVGQDESDLGKLSDFRCERFR